MIKNVSKISLFFLFLISFFITKEVFAIVDGNLQLGSSGADVRVLQSVLNVDPVTIVSVSGDGSKGQETEYFGNKTKAALVRFQRKYQITGESGRIGPKTGKLIEHLGPKLLKARKPGTKVIPTDWPESVSSPVQPANFVSPVVVAKKVVVATVRPQINSVSPTNVWNKSTVTIYGQGFTKTGNVIKTRYGQINNLNSSDGRTLSFTFEAPVGADFYSSLSQYSSALPSSVTVPIDFQVTNVNGVSNLSVFTWQIR